MSTKLACSNKPPWSRDEDKAFENALALYGNPDNRWEKIAGDVPSRTIAEIKEHYWNLCDDVEDIHAGRVPLPPYVDSLINSESCDAPDGSNNEQSEKKPNQSGQKEEGSRLYGRKKGKPWSSMEHGLFLQGLKKYGRGDWRSISRKCVLTKTSTQVASHAQKYFKRIDEVTAARKRTSIHDMAILDDGKLVTKRLVTKGEDEESVKESMLNIGHFPTLDSSAHIVSDNYLNNNNSNVNVPAPSFLPSLNATTTDCAQESLFKIPSIDFSPYPCTVQPDFSIPSWTEQVTGIQNHGLVSGSSGSQQVMYDPYGSIPQNMFGFSGFLDDPVVNTHGIPGFLDDLMISNQLGISEIMDDVIAVQQLEPPPFNGHQSLSALLAETVQEQQTLEEQPPLTGTIQNNVSVDKGKSPVESVENQWDNYVYDFKDFASASSSAFNMYDNNPTANQSFLLPDVSTKLDNLGTNVPMMDYSEYPSYDSFSPSLCDLEELEFPPSP